MMSIRSLAGACLSACVALGAFAVPASAQNYPTRTITMIVPFAAGGPTDVISRIVTAHMAQTLGQSIVIENVVGAGGTTATTRAARAANDGYTLVTGHMGTHAASVPLYPKLAYHPEKDFEPVALLAGTPILILAALVAVYLILGMLYESTIHPITILSTLPSAGLGALVALWAFGLGLDVIGLIGIILLIGIVKKNGIMMVDFAIAAERDQHMEPVAAIRQAALLRFRPIMMTTMAALLGAVPLAIGMGDGGELRQPLGIAIVGGLILSQVLTLYTTPVIYLYLDRFRLWVQRVRQGAALRPGSSLQPGE